VRDSKQFVMLWPDGHHDNHFPHLWCAAPPGAQASLIASDPDRFFRPPYVGGRGWIGVRLAGADWTEIAELCEDAYRAVAPAKLIALLDQDWFFSRRSLCSTVFGCLPLVVAGPGTVLVAAAPA